jgi:hypothetical protein
MSQKVGKPYRAASRPSVRQSKVSGYAIAVVVTALIAGALGAVIGYAVGRPDATTAAIADMQAADAKRDVKQISELTSLARVTAADLNKVLSGFSEAAPQDKASGVPPAGPVPVGDWQRVLRQAVDRHSATPSGTTATNVARAAFRNAVNAMSTAVDTYVAGRRLPASEQQAFVDLAVRQRSAAVAMWSVAATQLDQINIDAGNGHQHVYLSGTSEGAITADEVPEGTHTH